MLHIQTISVLAAHKHKGGTVARGLGSNSIPREKKSLQNDTKIIYIPFRNPLEISAQSVANID